MSTVNDKSFEELTVIKDELLKKFSIEELNKFYLTHSSRELEAYFKKEHNISWYYGEKIFLNMLGFKKKTRADSKDYWLTHMRNTHELKYGGIGFASPELANRSYSTNLERHGDKHYSNKEKANETKLLKYGDKNYNNSDQAVRTATARYGGVGFASTELRLRCDNTKLLKYGDKNYSNHKQRVATSRARWGSDNYNNREQTHKTCYERYGVSSYSQTSEFSRKRRKKYMFNGVTFDSSWELYLWIYCIDHDISIDIATVSFTYEFEGHTFTYHPDFIVNTTIVEVKGDHFFEDGKLINPYDRSEDARYNAKYMCALKNNVLVLKFEELKPIFNYIDTVYGKEYFRKFYYTKEDVDV